jgi:phosphoglycerate dehydrogenase-like enzyme
MVTKKPKMAIITSPQVGKPDVRRLSKVATLSYSDEVGIEEALRGARAALLWDVALMDTLRENWELTKDLEWLHVAVTGVDEMCFMEIRDSDIVLTNAGGVYNYAIAEYVTGAIIAYERNYPRLYYQKKRKQWKPFVSGSAQGKNALIIGPGRIGRTCARSLATLGMHVRGIGRHYAGDDPDFECIEPVERIEELVGWAHHLIVCAPLTDATYHLLNADLFKHCRSTVHIVNVGRGPIIDTGDLIDALQQGEVGGATIDVFEKEPLDPASPLWGMSVVMITPHIAGEIAGFEGALTDQFVDNALHWIRHEPLECVVSKKRGY